MATFIIPNVLLGLLILWPFLDRGPERRIHKRPVSIMVAVATIMFLGYMTHKGATTPEGGGEAPVVTIPESDTAAVAGEALFRENGCLSCHAVGSAGAPGPGPNLSNEGSKGRGKQWQIDHLKDPAGVNPGSSMPAFTAFTDEQYDQLATFLEGLGTKYK
jgi:mono/diheme cytochrome c family protein